MRLAYITNAGLTLGWAHSVQIMNMCKAFNEAGAEVTLVVPDRDLSAIDPFDYYNIPKTFSIKRIPCIDIFVGNPHKSFYWFRFISFYISARFYIWFNKFGFLYSRDLYSALFFPSIALELHSFPRKMNTLIKMIFNKKRKIIALTSFIKKRFVDIGVNEADIIVSPSAVDLEEFNVKQNEFDVRGIDNTDFVFGYIGTLKTMGMEKGVAGGLEALTMLPDEYKFLVVGGEESDVQYYKNMANDLKVSDRAIFIGKVSTAEVVKYASKCNVFIAPFPENEHFNFFMSPLKIFEYMASKRPIITTNLPSIRETLINGENAVLIPPSNSKILADTIVKIRDNPEMAKRISDKAYTDVVEKYTWNKRARKILNFLQE